MDINALEIRASELRGKINEAAGDDNADAKALDGMRADYGNVEARLRALRAVADASPTAADTTERRAFTKLENRASVGAIVDAIIDGRATTGATSELQTELKMNANHVPLSLLTAETRAAASVAAPSDVGRNQRPILDAVFPNGAAAFMNVSQPMVGVGESVYPVMTSANAAADVDEAAPVADSAGTFDAFNLTPRRIQASFTYSREDRAVFASMEDTLRRNLSDALSSGLDKYILTKTDLGLFDHGTAPTAPGAVAKYADYRAAILGRVDGIYASNAMDVKLLLNPATYQHADTVWRGNAVGEESGLEAVMRLSGGVRVSGHAPASSSNVSQAVTCRGPMGAAVAPVWNGIEIVFDNLTLLANGQLKLTAIMLANFKVLRADQYVRTSFKLA